MKVAGGTPREEGGSANDSCLGLEGCTMAVRGKAPTNGRFLRTSGMEISPVMNDSMCVPKRCGSLTDWVRQLACTLHGGNIIGDTIMAKIASKVMGDGFVRFEFADGQYLQCDMNDLTSNDIIGRLALHGISQKVGDSYAGAEGITEARLMAEGVWKNLKAGVWALKAVRGGKIVEALHRITGKAFDECLEKWASLGDDAQKALKKHPDIKRVMAEMEAERAKALSENAEGGTDLNDLF